MKPLIDHQRPIYLQIAEQIEDDILKKRLPEEAQVPSTNQFAGHYQINPATAAKGIHLLVEAGILYKKRGLGMFVAPGARSVIMTKRRQLFYEDYILPLWEEAKKLGLDSEALVRMITHAEKEGGAGHDR